MQTIANVVVTPEAAAAAKGFLFGIFAFSGWFFWSVVSIVLCLEFFWVTRSAAYERGVAATVFVALCLITLHVLGFVDVVANWRMLRKLALISLTIGPVYAAGRWYLALSRHSDVQRGKLEAEKERFLRSERSKGGANTSFDATAAEAEWQKVKPEKWAEIKKVNTEDSERFLFWVIWWPLDCLWKVVFQWFARVQDLLNLFWKLARPLVQSIKDAALKGADDGI